MGVIIAYKYIRMQLPTSRVLGGKENNHELEEIKPST
jgi:hypothetical protein